MTWDVRHGDCLEVLPTLAEASVDACVTDPPYGLEFMGREWDRLTYAGGNPSMKVGERAVKERGADWQPGSTYGGRQKSIRCLRCGKLQRGNGHCRCPTPDWSYRHDESGFQMQAWHERWCREVRRVLKPGAYLLAFGGTRTHHRLFSAAEDSGLIVQDCLSWLYGQGFPKGKTQLKPAWEPILLAYKPGKRTLNVDECRIPSGPDHAEKCASVVGLDSNRNGMAYGEWKGTREDSYNAAGRWPANVLLDEEAAAQLDEQSGELTSGTGAVKRATGAGYKGNALGAESRAVGTPMVEYGDTGGASRFFYTAKADSGERHYAGRNTHPTVKPVDLMRWLCRLVTPPGGLVLDPFTGSGSTGVAALAEGRRFLGIEREAEYVTLARKRIAGPLFADSGLAMDATPSA